MTSGSHSQHTCQGVSHYLVGGVSAHSVGRGLDGAVGSVDQEAAASEVFDPVAPPGVRLVCPGIHVKSK